MGHYTGLRIRAVVKEELRKHIEILHWDSSWDRMLMYHRDVGGDKILENALKAWIERDRCQFIPFGAVAYMPSDWGDNVREINGKTGVWEFCCSLKNYDKTIEYFLENLLPLLIESCKWCEKRQEGSEGASTHYRLVDGKMVVWKIVEHRDKRRELLNEGWTDEH
jgi:hypothetical protein